MSVVAKAAFICDLAKRLMFAQQRAATHGTRRVIQTLGINVFAAARTAVREQLLDVTQRNTCFRCYVGGAEIRIGKVFDHQTVDAREQLVRVVRVRALIRRRKQRANKIVERQLDVRVAGRQQRFITFICALNKIEQRASGARSAGPTCSPQRFESKMRDKRPTRQIEYQPLRHAIIHEACHGPGRID